jgi:hypothetical protein
VSRKAVYIKYACTTNRWKFPAFRLSGEKLLHEVLFFYITPVRFRAASYLMTTKFRGGLKHDRQTEDNS